MGFNLEKALRTVNGVKLPGGVVGKVSLVLLSSFMASISNGIDGLALEWILGGGIAAIFLLVFSMAELFHIYISPHKNATEEDVEKKLNLALDWYRYTKGVYIV